MINELLDIIERSLGTRPAQPASALAPENLRTPSAVLHVATRICQLAEEEGPAPESPHSVWRDAGAALVGFLAHPSLVLSSELAELPAIVGAPDRAWAEPDGDAYSCLCALVHELWEQCVEHEDDVESFIIDALYRGRTDALYDFGSGAGTLAMLMAQAGVAVTCYEPNRVKRLFLQRRARELKIGNLLELAEGKPDSYDAVLALNVLDHVADPLAAVEHLARVTHRGGALFTVAAFPDDDWHHGPEVGVRTERALTRYFEPESVKPRGFPGVLWRRKNNLELAL